MDEAFPLLRAVHWLGKHATPEEGSVSDVIYIGLTILVFTTLILLIKGVERFER